VLRLGQFVWLMAFLLTAGAISSPAAQEHPAGKSLTDQRPDATQQASPAAAGVSSSASLAPVATTHDATPEEFGDSDLARQRYQAAIAAYNKINDKSAAVWNKMGIAYQLMFNYNEALRCYKKSNKLDPKDSQVLNNLATVYGSMKNYSAADRMYRKALKLDPSSAVVLKNYGTNLMTQRKYAEGSKAYRQALAIDPSIFADHSGPTIQNAASLQDRGAMNYYMAVGCARAGYTDCALEYLRNALDEGYVNPKKVAADNDFASLRGNPAFQQLLAEQRSQ